MKRCAAFSKGVFSLGLPALALAAPSPYVSKFPSLDIQNDTSSTLIRDSQVENKVWDLSPRSGTVEFSGFTPSANLGFCEGLKSTISESNALSSQLVDLGSRLERLQPELDKAETDLMEARKTEAALRTKEVVKDLMDLDEQLAINDRRMDTLAKTLETCADAETCRVLKSELKSELKSIVDDSARLRELRRELRLSHRGEALAYEQASAAALAAEEYYSTLKARSNRFVSQISDVKATLSALYRDEGMLEAGTAYVDYKLGWTDNRMALARNHPQYEFSEIPTRNVRLSVALAGNSDRESYYSSLPAVLDYSVNGVGFQPWGDNKAESSSLPDVISGQFRLSLIGGCPLSDRSFFDRFDMKVPRGSHGDPLQFFYYLS